jgi:uncharacterized protein YydD (DUF2326 family)
MGKHDSELEDKIEELEEEIKILKATNAALRRRLKKTDDTFSEDEFLDESQIQKKYENINQFLCPSCKKKTMEEIEIANRTFRRCVSCGKRTKAKKI